MLNFKPIDNRKKVEVSCLEDLVPKNHILRKVDRVIDFGFIYPLVEPLYCKDNGRPSVDPVVLFKIVLIQYLFGIRSMRQTIYLPFVYGFYGIDRRRLRKLAQSASSYPGTRRIPP